MEWGVYRTPKSIQEVDPYSQMEHKSWYQLTMTLDTDVDTSLQSIILGGILTIDEYLEGVTVSYVLIEKNIIFVQFYFSSPVLYYLIAVATIIIAIVSAYAIYAIDTKFEKITEFLKEVGKDLLALSLVFGTAAILVREVKK